MVEKGYTALKFDPFGSAKHPYGEKNVLRLFEDGWEGWDLEDGV